MLKRKFRKLVNNPKLFFSDMAIKHSDKISYLKPKKMEGHYQYTVVSAVYNVGRYLDDYFESLVKQRLDFKKHIQLILVDDGSTDNSAEIIKHWQKKYPNNIQYIYKENGGQASARNLGMQYVKTEWVTFLDPDDLLDLEYFLALDKYMFTNSVRNISIVSCNLIFYYEDLKQYSDTHPLKFKYVEDKIISIKDIKNRFQLSASSAFFKRSIIEANKISFDKNVKPNFEDGKFISEYLLKCTNYEIAYIKSAKYIYRKRSDGSSTLDQSWSDVRRFDDVLQHGYLDLIKTSMKENGNLPEFIQNAILYDLIWHVKRFVNNPGKLDFLEQDRKVKYIQLLKEIFSYIDEKIILEFNLAGCWFYHKVGMLGLFKGTSPKQHIVYIDGYDKAKELIHIYYHSKEPSLEEIFVNGEDVTPVYEKTIKHDFVGETFTLERRIWCKMPKDNSVRVFINGSEARISLSSTQYKSGVPYSKIIEAYTDNNYNNKYAGAWLFMDRDTQADDNAEHLYRYVKDNYSDRNIFFILRKDSHDWKRLANDGFNLIEFGSSLHEQALTACSKVISSHADKYVTNYLGPKTLVGKHFIFLQHGVTKDDISSWLNQKDKIDCFVTCTKPEYESICSPGTRYKYTEKEVFLTGFPRHDRLIRMSENGVQNIILIMPTWRQSIVGKVQGEGNKRAINPHYMDSQFAISWCSFLQSERLKNLAEEHNYKIIFFPHANITPYLNVMNVPNHIEVASSNNSSIQELFSRAKFMITDYSSVAFEMAAQGKTVLYYQFDEAEVFSGDHIYAKGYFDYRRDGFGPVTTNEDELFSNLELILLNDGNPSALIKNRISETFPFQDGNNCERTYQAIVSLDEKLINDNPNVEKMVSHAKLASNRKSHKVAISRWSKIRNLESSYSDMCILHIAESYLELGRYSEALSLMSEISQDNDDSNYLYAKIYMSYHRWEHSLVYLRRIQEANENVIIDTLMVLCELSLQIDFNHYFAKNKHLIAKFVAHADFWKNMLLNDFKQARENLELAVGMYTESELKNMQTEILLARVCRLMGDLSSAHEYLINFEMHTKKHPKCREEIALLAYERKYFDKAIKQIQMAYPSPDDMPEPITTLLIRSYKELISEISCSISTAISPETILFKVRGLREKGRIGLAYNLMKENDIILAAYRDQNSVYTEYARIAMYQHDWQSAISYWERLSHHDGETGMARLRCLAELKYHKAIKRTLLDASWVSELPESQRRFSDALYLYAKGMLLDSISELQSALLFYTPSALTIHKPHLWLSRCYRESGQLLAAHIQLVEYEKLMKDDPQCREQIAYLSMAKGDMSKVISQLDKAYPIASDLPHKLAIMLVDALCKTNNLQRVNEILSLLPSEIKSEIVNNHMYADKNVA